MNLSEYIVAKHEYERIAEGYRLAELQKQYLAEREEGGL